MAREDGTQGRAKKQKSAGLGPATLDLNAKQIATESQEAAAPPAPASADAAEAAVSPGPEPVAAGGGDVVTPPEIGAGDNVAGTEASKVEAVTEAAEAPSIASEAPDSKPAETEVAGDVPRPEEKVEPPASEPPPPPRREPESAPLPPPPAPRSGLSTLVAALVGGVAGGVLVLLAGTLDLVPLGRSGGDAALASRLAAAEQGVAAARKAADQAASRLAGLETDAKAAQEAAGNALALAGEAQKAAAGSSAPPSAPPPDLSGLTDRLTKVEGEAATLGDGLRQVGTAANGLGQEIAAVKAAISATPDKAAAYAVALGQLSDAIRSGKPFTAELQTAKGLGGNAEALAPLAGLAETGVPSIEVLAAGYDAVKPKIEAALTPKPAPLPADAGVMDRITASLGGIVTVTHEGEGGEGDPAAAAGKVSHALHKGDLPAAIAAFKALPEAGQQAGAAWLTQAAGAAEALALIKAQTGAALQKFSGQ